MLNQGSDVSVTLSGTGCNPTPASPTTLAGGGTLTCTYTKTVTSTTAGTNKATATLSTGDAFSFTAPFDFSSVTPTEIDNSATLDDDFNPSGFPATLTGSSTITYTQDQSCGTTHSNTNTAVLKPSTSAQITDPATINVNCYALNVTSVL